MGDTRNSFDPPRWDRSGQPEPFQRDTAYAPPPYGGGTAAPFRPAAGAPPRHSSGPAYSINETWGPERRPAQPRPEQPAPRRTGRLDKNPWHWLLLIPIVVPLMPVLYNRIEPTLFGIPFFYWAQLSFAFLASGVIALVNLKDR